MTIGDFFVAKTQEVDPFLHEVAVMRQLIQERAHRLDLLRELISNSGAQEVGAHNIRITYYVHPQYGHSFEVADDGCGMNFTNSAQIPGRLDRFLGMGLSAIAGLQADEFSWKGLGAKLAYQSRKIEIETFDGKEAWTAVVNEPWQTIENGKKPRPRINQAEPPAGGRTGTTVKVYGHPPAQKEPFTFEQIRDYICHRTFVGYTRDRQLAPTITLIVQNRTEQISFGFPELSKVSVPSPEGTVVIDPPIVVNRNVPNTNTNIQVILKGMYTWDAGDYGLDEVHLNTGLILSVKGIPYFPLDMRKLESGQQLAVANPGVGKVCLIAECDAMGSQMNIARSGLIDSAETEHFLRLAADALQRVEDLDRHRAFRQVPTQRKNRKGADQLADRKKALESAHTVWVYWQDPATHKRTRLLRAPENETDTLAVLWKLEALGALPFANFESLGYSSSGADLVVHFQEEATSNPERYTTVEVEHRFFNYRDHGHSIAQYPTVICWEVNPKPKMAVKPTATPYKYVVHLEEAVLRIYTLSKMPGILLASEEDMERSNATQAWGPNL